MRCVALSKNSLFESFTCDTLQNHLMKFCIELISYEILYENHMFLISTLSRQAFAILRITVFRIVSQRFWGCQS